MSDKRIYKDEFNKILSSISDISDEEKHHLLDVFAPYLVNGLTAWELKEKIASLKFDKKDNLEEHELEKVKNKILSVLD